MFNPKTDRIKRLAEIFPDQIAALKEIMSGTTCVYIDLSNAMHWQNKLNWHLHLHRIKQLFDSFDTVKKVRLYVGTLKGNEKSENTIKEYEQWGYDVKTKPVKIMNISIDASSIASNSPILLQRFIRKALLEKLSLETIEFLNQKLVELNKQGILFIEDKKCNFDVEIGRHMLEDIEKNSVENFILWSTDSDFTDPIEQILSDGKNAFVFATAGRVSSELDDLKVPIFEVKKIKEFICWPRELPEEIRKKLELEKEL